jgi:pilus assembly protein Flp/PilA
MIEQSIASARSYRQKGRAPVTNLRRLLNEDEGVTVIEYALIGSLVSILIVAAVTAMGTTLLNIFNQLAAAI